MTDLNLLDVYRYRRVGPVELYLGDARQVLAATPDASVDSIVTSPPFWGLRDYGTGRWRGGDPACPHPLGADRRIDGASCGRCGAEWADPQYGLEPTVEKYVDRLVAVFDEARRVLDTAGTLWLNLGDSYTGGTRRAYHRGESNAPGRAPLPPKNLIGVPWRVALALQGRGWWLFSGSRRSSGRLNVYVSAAQRLMTKLYGLQQLWCKRPVACRDVVSPKRGGWSSQRALQGLVDSEEVPPWMSWTGGPERVVEPAAPAPRWTQRTSAGTASPVERSTTSEPVRGMA